MTTTIDPAAISARQAAAERIARAAGQLALGYFHDRDGLTVERKADAQDRVSAADRAVEAFIRGAVAEQFPEDALLGEELGQSAGRSAFTWIIDPIDGTTPFLSGLPDWCVSIAVAIGNRPMIGAIDAPRLGETWVGARDRGATMNGKPLRLDPATSITDGFLAVGASLRCAPEATGSFIARLMRQGGVPYHNGSGALMLGHVASGRLVGYYDAHIMPWDCFAGGVLVAAAGGQMHFGAADRMARGGRLAAGPREIVRTIARLLMPE